MTRDEWLADASNWEEMKRSMEIAVTAEPPPHYPMLQFLNRTAKLAEVDYDAEKFDEEELLRWFVDCLLTLAVCEEEPDGR